MTEKDAEAVYEILTRELAVDRAQLTPPRASSSAAFTSTETARAVSALARSAARRASSTRSAR